MIWVTIQYIRNIKIKYFPCLVILWIIYRYILHQIDSILSLDLGFWKAFSLHQYLSLLAVYVMASVMATAYIFWTYKPHQNHYIAFIIYFLQLALALGFIFQAKLHKTDFDVLLCLVKIIVISKIVTKIALYVWLYIKEIFKMATNFILYSLKGLAKIIMKIMSFSATLPLNFIKACYKSFKKAVKICYNATKTFAKTVFPWIWVVASFTGRVWSKCVLIFPRTSSKYTQICLDLTAVSIWYTMYFCGVMRVWFQKLVSTIKQLCMCVQTEIMINGARRFSSFISSGDHVTDAEREEHHRSSHVYPCAKATDSESSEESD
ncbi:uncharacterized protein LOC125670736 isoform X2 [Ostrea edulis]|uniref:uncharacterized protein LOC125670736 isoform X2 n=1 Tax=Ostrea edulis TaxID=37623 RepID=UPI0024AE8947|nr:uncharacterized protein LOC125670736 isoform X2 [Ostrea edulis]